MPHAARAHAAPSNARSGRPRVAADARVVASARRRAGASTRARVDAVPRVGARASVIGVAMSRAFGTRRRDTSRMPSVAVVKFGGAVLTDKRRRGVVDARGLADCARVARAARDAGVSLIIAHGAGSFGHGATPRRERRARRELSRRAATRD